MSEEKVKIVIEIPTGVYRSIKNGFRAWDGGSIVQDAIEETGIPLSDVIDRIRAEIAKPHDIDLGQLSARSNVGIMEFGCNAYLKGKDYALSIIDEHIGGKDGEE